MIGAIAATICHRGSFSRGGNSHMQVTIAGIAVFGGAAAIVFLSSLDLSGWLKVAIVIPLVLLVVYSLARIHPKETTSEKDIGT